MGETPPMKIRFTRSVLGTLLPTLLGLALLLVMPVWSLLRIENLHRRIEGEIVPARERIERAMIRSHWIRADAHDFIDTLNVSVADRYKRHQRDWLAAAQSVPLAALRNSELTVTWQASIRDMQAWIRTVGDATIVNGEAFSTQEGFRLFQQSMNEMEAAERILDRMETDARGQVREWEQGAIAATGGLGVLCGLLLLFSWRNATALHDALSAASRSAERLEAAVKETNHRVKNNLQTIGALIDMNRQEHGAQVPASVLNDIYQQVRTVAAVHDFLSHESSANQVSVRPMLEKLVKLTAAASGMKTVVTAETIELPVKQATSLALITNELILNAGKHGAKCAHVEFATQDGHCCLRVWDDGPGLPSDFTVATHGNLGTGLVETLTRHDLSGEVAWGSGQELSGAEIKIRFHHREAD